MATNKTERSVWDRIDDDELDDNRLPFMYPGNFTLAVREIAHYPSSKKKNEEWFRVDFDIVEGAQRGKTAVTWLVKMSLADEDAIERALRDIRSFVRALMGEEEHISRDLMLRLTGQDQPAKGMTLYAECEEITTQAGKPFNKVRFSPMDVE